MVRKLTEKSGSYAAIGTGGGPSEPRSDLAPGIGTRISAAADTLKSRKRAAEVMEVSTDSLQRYIREEVQAPFAAVARLALATNYSLEWLATGLEAFRAPPDDAASQELSEAHLTIALELTDRAIGTGWLPRPLYAKLLRLIYDGIRRGLPMAEVADIAAASARKLAQGGVEDGGEQGLGGTGGGGAGGSPPKLPGQGDW